MKVRQNSGQYTPVTVFSDHSVDQIMSDIDSINQKIGQQTLSTESQKIIEAINEINEDTTALKNDITDIKYAENGKNLLMGFAGVNSGTIKTPYSHHLKAGTYTISGIPSAGTKAFFVIRQVNGADSTNLVAENIASGTTKFTFELNDEYDVKFQINLDGISASAVNQTCQIEKGATATSFEPHWENLNELASGVASVKSDITPLKYITPNVARVVGTYNGKNLYNIMYEIIVPSSIQAKTVTTIASNVVHSRYVVREQVSSYNSGGSIVGNYYISDNDRLSVYHQGTEIKAVVGTASHFAGQKVFLDVHYTSA